jgi:hypothetical protein
MHDRVQDVGRGQDVAASATKVALLAARATGRNRFP